MSPIDFLASLILAALGVFVGWHLLILAIGIVIAPFYWAYRLIRLTLRVAWRTVRLFVRLAFGLLRIIVRVALWITRRLDRPTNAERVVIDFQAERRRRRSWRTAR